MYVGPQGGAATVPRQREGRRWRSLRSSSWASRSSACKSRCGTRAEIAALRNRVDANEVRIEEVVLMINELREYVEARFAALEKAIDARFKQVHETMANNLQVLLAAIDARK